MKSGKGTIVIVGGGLSGLVCALLLNRYGFYVRLIEKKHYPFHRVCGEYISNEVLPFFKSLDIDVMSLNPSRISRMNLNSVSGKQFSTRLDSGGFGLSRYAFDEFLFHKARAEGVDFNLGSKVNQVCFEGNEFRVFLSDNEIITADFVIGAFGKRSNLDQKLQRDFFYKRSPYVGVKYHIKTDFPADLIQLSDFAGGYCGIVKIENGKYCLCYLSRNSHLKKYGSIEALENEVLFKNPCLKYYFQNSDFLFNKPEVINEISFEQKSLVDRHIFFCGDAAGMIAPLCGNGMAMAIHAAKVLTEVIRSGGNSAPTPQKRVLLEEAYISQWKRIFSKRLKTGRVIQKVFSSNLLFNAGIRVLNGVPSASKFIIRLTHGKPFL